MRAGLKLLRCEVCGREQEVEAGIRSMYCCAKQMREVSREELEAEARAKEQANGAPQR